jgi:hypothetical protein
MGVVTVVVDSPSTEKAKPKKARKISTLLGSSNHSIPDPVPVLRPTCSPKP